MSSHLHRGLYSGLGAALLLAGIAFTYNYFTYVKHSRTGRKEQKNARILETSFDVIYLVTVITLGILMIRKAMETRSICYLNHGSHFRGRRMPSIWFPGIRAVYHQALGLHGRPSWQIHHFYYHDPFLHTALLCMEAPLSDKGSEYAGPF